MTLAKFYFKLSSNPASGFLPRFGSSAPFGLTLSSKRLGGSWNLKITGFLSRKSRTRHTSVGASSQMNMKYSFFERFQFNTGLCSGNSNVSSPLMVHTYRRNGHPLLFFLITLSLISTRTGQKSPFSLY